MKPKWSPHAKGLLADILYAITTELSEEDALRWRNRIQAATDQLADFPNIGTAIPLVCFNTPPEDADKLRQVICKPYRIVYESLGDEIHILSIRHSRMLVAEGDTYWN